MEIKGLHNVNYEMIITRKFEIDYGHRLMNHTGLCRNLHGHRGVFEISVSSKKIVDGMVMDFVDLKDIGNRIFSEYDHAFFIEEKDEKLLKFLREENMKIILMENAPTIENIVTVVHHDLWKELFKLGRKIEIERIKAFETPDCWAEWVKK